MQAVDSLQRLVYRRAGPGSDEIAQRPVAIVDLLAGRLRRRPGALRYRATGLSRCCGIGCEFFRAALGGDLAAASPGGAGGG